MPDSPKPTRDATLAALRWQIDMGADEAIGDAPIDGRRPQKAPTEAAPRPTPAPAAWPIVLSPDAAVEGARRLAESATTIQLRE